MGKQDFCLCENKGAIGTFVFATWKVQYLLYFYPKFQDSSVVYRLVCVATGQKHDDQFLKSRLICLYDNSQFSTVKLTNKT